MPSASRRACDRADAIDPGVPVAYVAQGEAFPDALAGSVLAALNNAPLVLVSGTRFANTIPQATRDELTRLEPDRIVIYGGPAAVSDAVKTQLEAFAQADTAEEVTRISGIDRFATAAQISRALPNPPEPPAPAADVPTAFIATRASEPEVTSTSLPPIGESTYRSLVSVAVEGLEGCGDETATWTVSVEASAVAVNESGAGGDTEYGIRRGVTGGPDASTVQTVRSSGGTAIPAATSLLATIAEGETATFHLTGRASTDSSKSREHLITVSSVGSTCPSSGS